MDITKEYEIEHTDTLVIARVVEEHKSSYTLRIYTIGEKTFELSASIRGKLLKSGDIPKVGDFVEYSTATTASDKNQAVIENILPRQSEIVRDIADRSRRSNVERPQVIVTNVDVIFIVMGLDGDFSVSRLDRYVTLANQSKVKPVIILNKVDMISDRALFDSQVATIAPAVPIYFISAMSGYGMEVFDSYLGKDKTAVLLGSSGAGKSTITNWLLKTEKQITGNIREDDSRGRHTTTSRALFDLPNGGFLIDTPGMRGLGLMSSAEAVTLSNKENIFADIEALTVECKYPDCDHEKSTGCAVLKAIEEGLILEKHFQSYLKLKREQEYNASKNDGVVGKNRKEKAKQIHKEYNKIKRHKYSDRRG